MSRTGPMRADLNVEVTAGAVATGRGPLPVFFDDRWPTWLLPTHDCSTAVACPGDGVIDFGQIGRLVAVADNHGTVEVEVFNPDRWAPSGSEVPAGRRAL